MLGKRRWPSLLLVASLAVLGLGLAAGADSATESEFLSLINSSRASNGLGPLSVDGGLAAHAGTHTQDMMNAGSIYHSTSAELAAAGGSGWSKMGENVGKGQSPSSLHTAFMNSAGHRDNILGDYNYVGIGTGSSGGYLYVTVVFMKKGETSAPPTTEAPAPSTTSASPAPTTAPGPGATNQAPAEPTTTTATLPPTTTTTLIVPPDKAVTPGQSCVEANRYYQLCHN
jgi:hypothetical protein